MRVVPVVDIQNGVVVAARFGERAAYRPIVTPLAASANPADVVAGLMALHPFDTLYIADLDGIEGRGRNDGIVTDLAARHPGVALWVDNGLADAAAATDWLARHPARLVLGTESGPAVATLAALGDRAVLSLDYRGDAYLGPTDVLDTPAAWPHDVVVMTLGRVGSGAGPDLDRLADILGRAPPDCRLHAAGGVRGPEDLAALAARGIAGALVASALHDGRLGASDLAAVADRPSAFVRG